MENVIRKLRTDLKYNPVKNSFNGDIFLTDSGITSLKGFPKFVNGGVNLSRNDLTSLEYGPERVDYSFIIRDNFHLKTLKFLPKQVLGRYINTCGSPIIDISYTVNCDITPSLLMTYREDLALLPGIKCGVEFDPIKPNLHEIFIKHWQKEPTKINIIELQFDLIENGYATNARWEP